MPWWAAQVILAPNSSAHAPEPTGVFTSNAAVLAECWTEKCDAVLK